MNHKRFIGTLALLSSVLLLSFLIIPRIVRARARDPITAAWEKAQAAGSYNFSSDLTQVTMPLVTVGNVGHSSHTDKLHLEGQNDLRNDKIEMQIWADSGSILQSESAATIKVEAGKAQMRKGSGDWEEINDFTAAVAPQGDFLAYLAATRNVTAHAIEKQSPSGQRISLTRYDFEIDGPTFALYVRGQMEAAMRAKGELAADAHLDVPPYFRDMTGEGELWVAADGLPLRQTLTLQFPEQKNQQVSAQISVDFSKFGTPQTSPLAMIRAGNLSGFFQALAASLPDTSPILVLLPMLALLTVVALNRRKRTVQNALVLTIIASMVASPLLNTFTNVRLFDAQTAKAATEQERQENALQEREVRDALGKVEFNPHQNPLETGTNAEFGVLNAESATIEQESALRIQPAALQAVIALPAGATHWWPAQLNANDVVGTGSGSPKGSLAYADGLVGKAFSLNGSNSYVALPDNLFPFPTSGTGNTPFSFELWFKTAAAGVILGQQTGEPGSAVSGYVPAIYVGTDGKLHVKMFWGGLNSVTSASSVTDNIWHHIGVAYNGTTQSVYLDGSTIGNFTLTQTSYNANYKYQLGVGLTTGWNAGPTGWSYFNGLIDEPTLYSRALTAAEMLGIYNARNSGKNLDNGVDSDGDSLSDFVEARVGTDPNYRDSDEDTVADNLELRGFVLGGQTWYGNPNDVDSNHDGLGDALEWDANNDGTADDTDSDGLPDIYDTDNDNDGVPDNKDGAPFSFVQRSGGFDEANPFKLTINNLTAGKPTFVDFQIRPTTESHLRFAFNVLDWPQDNLGQVQDIDNKTYADLGGTGANDAIGDMKLIPMLELRMPASSANLPSQSDLTPYSINVTNFSADGATKVVYIPLSVVSDEQSGQRVAFNARMRYLPTGAWAAAHEVRLAWVVQALVDLPTQQCNATATPPITTDCTADGYIHNQPQVLHSYYDGFTLTGLNVREDNGAGVAIVYEDPAVDSNKKDDAPLVALSHGLDNAFLAARDQNNNSLRDVDLNELARRFNRTSNSGVSETERWAIPNTLRVEKQEYATADQAVITTAMTETKRVLNNVFTSAWQSDKGVIPLLMYAQEEKYRAMGLDGMRTTGNYVTFSGTTLTVSMTPAGQPQVPLETLASLKWTPYCAPAAAQPLWSPCTLDGYWGTLEQRYDVNTGLPGDPNEAGIAQGRMVLLQLYMMGLTEGVSRVVVRGNALVSSQYTLKTDSQIEELARVGLQGGAAAVKGITNLVLIARLDYLSKPGGPVTNTGKAILKYLARQFYELRGSELGQGLRDGPINILRSMRSGGHINRLAGTGIIVAVSVLVGALAAGLYLLADSFLSSDPTRVLGAKITIKILIIGLTTFLSVISPIMTLAEWAGAVKAAGGGVSLLRAGSQLIGSTVKASAVGAVIGVAIAWGFFIYSMVANNVSAFSPEFNKALAETIATTIYLLFLFILSLTAVGTIIVGIIAFIDAVLTAVCELGVDELRQQAFYGGACITIGSTVTKGIAYLLYNYDMMIDTGRSDLVTTGAPDIILGNPNKGYVEGNTLSFTLPVTTTVVHKDPNASSGPYIQGYLYLFSPDNLRQTIFNYALTTIDKKPVYIPGVYNFVEWHNVVEDHRYRGQPMYRGTTNTLPLHPSEQPTITGLPLRAGVNVPAAFNFNMHYGLPASECYPNSFWLPLFSSQAYTCRTKTYDGNSTTLIESLKFDVFPATLDGFMSLRLLDSGQYGLGWDPAFRFLNDADGDGLWSGAFAGLDPDDSKPDTDGDGLTDANEIERRYNGMAFSPTACDGDSDGLTDLQEAQSGSNPASADSDGDGLKDGEEVWHRTYNGTTCQPTNTYSGGWNVTVSGSTPLTVRVSANPTRSDSDADGINDLAEFQLRDRVDTENFPYHPDIQNVPILAVYSAVSDDDRIVKPGQSFVYTTTVVANQALASGTLTVNTPKLSGNPNPPYTYAVNMSSGQSVVQQTNFTIGPLYYLDGLNGKFPISSLAQVRVDDSAGASTVTASNGLTVTIDDVLPEVDLSAWQNSSIRPYIQGSVGTPKTYIFGGGATDQTSGVDRITVQVNNGAQQPATGQASWAFPLQVTEGVYDLIVNAFDKAGNQNRLGERLIADGTVPQVFLTAPTQQLTRANTGQWQTNLSGNYYDFGQFPSGVATVEVLLTGQAGSALGNGWQPATLASGIWSINYRFAQALFDPIGSYTVYVRATDRVGNLSADNGVQGATPIVTLDGAGPSAALTKSDVARNLLSDTISTTVTLGGVISDTGTAGVNGLDVSFVPLTQSFVLSGSVISLPFDEAAGSGYFQDNSGQSSNGTCSDNTCPTAGVAGRIDSAVQFDGVNDFVTVNRSVSDDFTIALWVKEDLNSIVSQIIVDQGANLTNGWTVWLSSGRPGFLIGQNGVFVGANRIDDNTWHFVSVTRQRSSGKVVMYVDGVAVNTTTFSTAALNDVTNIRIGGHRNNNYYYRGAVDQLQLFNRTFNAAEVKALYQSANRQWFPATLAQRGAGIASSNWTLLLPNGLEGLYQIDLRANDIKGNRLFNGNTWRGLIDTVAPRVVMSGTATGQSYIDPADNTRKYEIRYSCVASDWQLEETKFTCPGNASQPASRSFNSDPILQSVYPTVTLITTLTNTWTIYQASATPNATLRACDMVGNCTSSLLGAGVVAASETVGQWDSGTVDAVGETYSVAAAEVSAAPGAPKAVIVDPSEESTISATAGIVEVTIAAEAERGLKEATLLLDGDVVAVFPFARIDKVQNALATVNLSVTAGRHTLSATASDWAGNVQRELVMHHFVVSNQKPALTIDGGLDVSNTWALESGIVVLQGTVSNSENLAAVQVKVGDQPYINAMFGNGRWGAAYPVGDPEGKTLAVTVRAIDKAGQISKLGDGVVTDFSTANPPETTLVQTPPASSAETSAVFSFTGAANGEPIFAFECQLDEAVFTACSSPQRYSELSNGSHTFRVHAINGQGYEDLTAAVYIWTVQSDGVQVEIDEMPANPGSSRSASFEFNPAGADDSEASYECSLDGSSFTACSEPQSYSGLSDGNHVFQVRIVGGTASRYTWRIINSAPVAASQVLTNGQNVNLPVKLVANDEDAVTYQIVSKPTHGLLEGTAPNFTYDPDTDFFGTDNFSFVADDGDAESNLATVTIHVTPTPGQGGLQRDGFVVFGQEGVILRENVKVISGDIAASLSSQGPWLGDGAEVSIGSGVTFADAKSKVLGDSLFVGQGTALGDANFNELRGPGTVKGTKVTPQALPLLSRFVSLPAIGVGKQNVEVAANGKVTLQPGSYLSLNVGKGGEVTFSGGVYSFKEWNVGDNSKLTFAGASEIRIANRALVGMNSYVGPASSSTVSAKQIVIFVAGVNANSAVLGGLGEKAATFGPYATLAANVVVPNGTLLIRERSKAVGSFVGRWVSVGKFSELTLANRFNTSAVDGRVSDFVSLTLDDASGINATAPLSPNVNDELLSEEGSTEENPSGAQPSKIFLPVISSGAVDSRPVDSETVSDLRSPVSPQAANNVVFLPVVVK